MDVLKEEMGGLVYPKAPLRFSWSSLPWILEDSLMTSPVRYTNVSWVSVTYNQESPDSL